MQAHRLTRKSRRVLTTATLSLLLNLAAAQVTPSTPPAAPAADSEDDETIVLSPFVVDASQDEGYRATSTLAGSRINTNLKDIASPITVVTKEFLTDTGSVDINDVMAYTGSTEGVRDFTSNTISLGNRPTDNVAANFNTANRVRGLAAPTITRDYFYTLATNIGFDTYNLDQVTVNRGPNSVLAGLGSPAGIIDYSAQLAGLTKNFNQVSLRYGSWDDMRATFNSNVVIKKDVLGVRLAGAWSDRGFEQQPAHYRDARLFLTTTYRPWAKTTIRASVEKVEIDSKYPNTLTPEDDISQWAAAGKPTVRSGSGEPIPPGMFGDMGTPAIIFNADGSLTRGYNTGSGYVFNQQIRSGFTPLRMNSNKYIQLDEVNLSPSTSSPLKYDAFNLSLDQEIVANLFANVAYVHEKTNNDYINLFRSEYATYLIDVNELLPDGTPNPHLGETYMQFRGLDNKQKNRNTNDVIRGTVTYDLDLTKYNKWFGRYRISAFGESRETETENWTWNARDADHPATYESIGYRYYLGGSETRMATTVPMEPQLYTDAPYFDGTQNTTLDSFYALKSNNRQLTKLESYAAVIQGHLWDNRIMPMFGIRKDKNRAWYASSAGTSGGIASPAGAYPDTDGGPLAHTTRTYGVVVRPLKWLAFHYNQSENFTPNAGSVDLMGNPSPLPTGESKDYGFSVSLLDDKLNAKVNWFELTAAGAAAGNANFPLAQWTIPYLELTFFPELAQKAGVQYQKLMADGLVTGDPRLANAYTSDNVSKGVEFELTYNVTKNWRVMANLSKQDAKQTNIASGLTEFIKNRLAYWQSIPQLWNDPNYTASGWGVQRTGEQQWNSDNNPYYIAYKSVDGQPSQQLAKWRGSVLTRYQFTEGPLQGFHIGLGARYIDKAIIGNPNIYDETGTAIALDLAHPYYANSYIAVDAFAGYKMKLFANKYDMTIQLNARDLQEGGGFWPIQANPDGVHSVYRIVQPRSFYLTVTLDF